MAVLFEFLIKQREIIFAWEAALRSLWIIVISSGARNLYCWFRKIPHYIRNDKDGLFRDSLTPWQPLRCNYIKNSWLTTKLRKLWLNPSTGRTIIYWLHSWWAYRTMNVINLIRASLSRWLMKRILHYRRCYSRCLAKAVFLSLHFIFKKTINNKKQKNNWANSQVM